MKYFIYAALLFISALMFLPKGNSTEIRNLPLFILILFIIVLVIAIRFLKFIFLMQKTKNLLSTNRFQIIKTKIIPWASFFSGHYSIIFKYKQKIAQIIFLRRKRKYQRYHFESADRLEFYCTKRVAFKNARGSAGVSNSVEVNQVGKQKLKWDPSAEIRIILFDKLPNDITDSASKQGLAATDKICNTNARIFDKKTFFAKYDKIDI